jgi:hypothetical protein
MPLTQLKKRLANYRKPQERLAKKRPAKHRRPQGRRAELPMEPDLLESPIEPGLLKKAVTGEHDMTGGPPDDPPSDRRKPELDLEYARLSLGVDLLAFVALDRESATPRFVPTEMAQPDEGSELDSLSLDATCRAIKSLTSDQWVHTLDSRMRGTKEGIPDPDEYHECLMRPDLEQWLPQNLLEQPIGGQPGYTGSTTTFREILPNAAVVGCWPRSPSTGLLGFYFAAWLHDSYEIVCPLSQIAQDVHSFLTLFAFPTTAPDTPRFGADCERGEYQQLELEHRRYPLRGRRRWVFNARNQRLYVRGLAPVYIGQGRDEPAARADLTEKLDRDFQDLYGTRPPHRDETQERVWRLLCRVIDLDAYRDRRPFRATRAGRIRRVSADARVVGWEDERGSERILLRNAPREFAEIPKGGRFEATILYHPGTDELSEEDLPRIESCRPLDEVNRERVAAFWERLLQRGAQPGPETETGKPH